MDTSEQYIKMCDCEEIQNEWKPKDGDFYIIGKGKHAAVNSYTPCCDGCKEEVNNCRPDCVWLPRQDQLQAMLDSKFINIWLRYGFLHQHYTKEKSSMEQVWLACVMHNKHNKKWNGNKWEEAK